MEKVTKGWMIVKDGRTYPNTFNPRKAISIQIIMKNLSKKIDTPFDFLESWIAMMDDGYRCVKAQIREGWE